jgi:hypothetical protein
MLIEMAKKVFPELGKGPSTSKLQEAAACAKPEQLTNAGVPEKYWQTLRNLREVQI